MFETMFRDALLANVPGIAAVLEGPIPVEFTPGRFPIITFQRVATVYSYTHGGQDALYPIRVQVNCWALEPEQARAFADLVRASLPLFNFSVLATDPVTVTTESPNKALMQIASEEPDTEPITFREILDCEIWYLDQ